MKCVLTNGFETICVPGSNSPHQVGLGGTTEPSLRLKVKEKRDLGGLIIFNFHLCKSEVWSLQRELKMAQFLLSSCKTRFMFMAKTNIKVKTERC